MMSKTLAAVVLSCGLLCALASADEGPGPSGINTYTTHSGSPAGYSYITCWRTQPPYGGWSEWSDYVYTGSQPWPPDYNRLRWADSSQSDPKEEIETGWYYTFKGKKYISGQWWYSNWSVAVYYNSPTKYAYRELDLSLTEDPGDPSNIEVED